MIPFPRVKVLSPQTNPAHLSSVRQKNKLCFGVNMVKTNIITGFLGSGKTTAIRSLLLRKPEKEYWAVVVNEFGEIGVDQDLLQASDEIIIKEIPGGCLCCSASVSIQVTMNELFRKLTPDRILIEPTGLGHPAGVIELLRNEHFRKVIDLRATIGLVDLHQWQQPRYHEHPTYRGQLQMADILLANKTDLAEEETIKQFLKWANGLYPPKSRIGTTREGWIETEWLDLAPYTNPSALKPSSAGHKHDHSHTQHDHSHAQHDHSHAQHVHAAEEVAPGREVLSVAGPAPQPGQPLRRLHHAEGFSTCGWLFHEEDTFDAHKLRKVFEEHTEVFRRKGVFRVANKYVAFNAAGGEVSAETVAYRRESRADFIAEPGTTPDWEAIEAEILATVKA